jgi:DOPA 4,5-dioxygenase
MANKPAPTSAPTPEDPRIIRDYHAHIYYDPASTCYYDPASTRARAARLRERVGAAFPEAKLGRWHDELVGPHPQSMYQIAFPRTMLASFLPWLMLNRDGLTILLHPGTGNDYADHSDHAVWFGAVLPLRLEVLKGAPKK